MNRLLTFIALLFCAMLIAGLYGSVHDQISFSVSSEYFTRFKYLQFGLVNSALPDRVKAAWIGFLASWWMGLPIGLIVGAMGFSHPTARLMFLRTLKAYGVVCAVTLLVGLGGLAYGWFFASHQVGDYPLWFIPSELRQPAQFLAVAHMHNFSYMGGGVGLLAGIAAQIFQWRAKPKRDPAETPYQSDRIGADEQR